MIYVTRLNHTPVVLNAELIEHVETTPDTVISLTTGQKFMVLESTEEIIRRVMNFRRAIVAPCAPAADAAVNPSCGAPDNQSYGQR
ncbi:MAG TPA: flagellar FlbD family protein [Bryobacteraceae bacterium]|nr:flagellar FlbD family protein [Bryobacteraceae bacterium]